MRYRPEAGLFVTVLGSKSAERHERFVCNVPEGTGLAYKPHTILVSKDAVSYSAFDSIREFKRWLGKNYTLKLSRYPRNKARYSVATGRIELK